MTTDAALPIERPRPDPPPRWQRNLVFGIIGSTIVAGWVGDALWASLVDRHPLALLALNAKPRYLVLTVNRIDAWAFYPFATVRLVATKPLVWLIGYWYGHRAVAWAESQSKRGAGAIAWLERHFARFGWIVIAITSNNVVCLLAGAGGFHLGWFMALAVIGTVAKLWVVDVVGATFTDEIDDVIGFVADHRAIVVAISVAVVAGGLAWQHRRGRSGLDELASLEHAMEEPEP